MDEVDDSVQMWKQVKQDVVDSAKKCGSVRVEERFQRRKEEKRKIKRSIYQSIKEINKLSK